MANLYNPSPKKCYFCQEGMSEIDYKDVKCLQKYISYYGKIEPRWKTGLCNKHQNKLARAIKRARYMALLPYISE